MWWVIVHPFALCRTVDQSADKLESAVRQAGNNAVPMRPGIGGASPSLQGMRERAREAAEAASEKRSAAESGHDAAVRPFCQT